MTQRHKGFSLIEVAIAMVIFVIGALAILRIFPTGISLVEKSGNQQIASNSSRSILARLDNEDAFPDATVNLVTGGSTWEGFDGSVIGSSKYNRTLPKDVSAWQLLNSSLDHYKGISGEKVVVKEGGNITTPYPYILTQFSVANILTAQLYKVDALENATITGTTTKTLDLTNVVTKSELPFTQPTIGDTRIFYVTYKYKVGSPARIAGVDNEAIPVDATGKVTIPNSDALIGSVEVKVKELVAGGIDTGTPPELLRCGLVKLTGTFSDNRPLFIDYATDWYWILENLTPTAADDVFKRREIVDGELVPVQGTGDSHRNNYRQVELSIPFVQGRTSQRYATLVMENGGIGRHFTWLNIDGTLPLPNNTLVRLPHLQNDSEVDYPNYRNTLREGKIGFDMTVPLATANPAPAIASPVVRVAYRTQDGWARQLSVSAKSYKPYNGTTLVERWRDYYQDGNTLYFQASEAGKAVKVTYSYGDPGADASGDLVKTELLTIGSDIKFDNKLGSPPSATGDLPLVTLPITPETGSVTSILSVKGASVTARTAWLSNDKYNQSLVTSMRGDS